MVQQLEQHATYLFWDSGDAIGADVEMLQTGQAPQILPWDVDYGVVLQVQLVQFWRAVTRTLEREGLHRCQ